MWLRITRVEVYPLVKMPHLNIASLFLSHLIGEVTQPLAGHPQQIHQLCVMSMVHENLH